MNTLNQLNPAQKKAVLHTDGPLLVIAGAGAGKTMVITQRIANLINSGIKPEEILAVTFTNKAAKEMKERIYNLINRQKDPLSGSVRQPAVGTFHSICVRILKQNGKALSLPRTFSILDKEDSLKIIKAIQKELDINPKQFQPKKIQSIISKQKSQLIKVEEYMETAGMNFFPKTIAMVWEQYEKNLSKQKAVDFDDLISKTVHLLKERPEILQKYHNRWKYILVDEYQDTNHAQYILTKLLAKKNQNICVVGDEDQSIYSFRGANFGNILNFEKDWPNSKVVKLEQNYRSTQKILDAANAVINKNEMRKPKNLFTEMENGENITVFAAANEREEAEFVSQAAQNLIDNGVKPYQIAVLYRANFQSRVLEESFIKNGIPYQVMGTKFFERKEVKDIIAYIKAALNPDNLINLERIISEPPRGLGKTSLLNYISGNRLTSDKAKKMEDFFSFLKNLKKILFQKPLSEAIGYTIDASGYGKNLNKKTEEGIMRLDNLKELVTLAVKYDKLEPETAVESFLEDVSLMSGQDEIEDNQSKNGSVRLMTVHAAKGLEFPYIFIAGLEDGLCPYIRSMSLTKLEEEEERRLFYVAITRAKQKLFMSFACSRMLFGGKQMNKPSRFLEEIPQELFEDSVMDSNSLRYDLPEDEMPTTNYLEF